MAIKRNKLAVVGLIGLIIIILFALIGPLFSSHDYAEQNVEERNLPAKIPVLDKIPFLPFDGEGVDGKSAYKEAGADDNYWFGTDQLGRDLWSRTWQGTGIIIYRCNSSITRYLYWGNIWCDIWLLRR